MSQMQTHPTTGLSLNPWRHEPDPVRLAQLGKLGEEMCEAGAMLCRSVIQGIDEAEPVTGKPNRQAVSDELADVQAGIIVLLDVLGMEMDAARVKLKIAHLKAWHALVCQETR